MTQRITIRPTAAAFILLSFLLGCGRSEETYFPLPVATTGTTTPPGSSSSAGATTPPQPGQPPVNTPAGGGSWTSVFNPNLPVAPPAPRLPRLVVLGNSRARVGIDLVAGGAITFLTDGPQGQNMINNFDLGRQLQTSLYSGPIPYEPNGKKPVYQWRNLGWNPVQTGDVHHNPAQVIGYQQFGSDRLYVKTVPLIWPLLNEPADCVMEHWITLQDNVVHVRSRTQLNRRDTTQYEARTQEAPCVYMNGPFAQVTMYSGAEPFTGGPVSTIGAEKGLTTRHATENWTALLNKEGRGVGLYVPNQYRFATGFFGTSGNGTEYDEPSGYQAATPLIVLDHNGVYEFDYHLIIGTITDIRAFVYAQPRPSPVPDYRFTTDRLGWHYYNTIDTGWPIRNELAIRWGRVDMSKAAFNVKSPRVFWRAANIPKLFIQAAFTTTATTARLNWQKPGDSDFLGTPDRILDFPITGDGQMRTYEINLAGRDGWNGMIQQIQLEAPPGHFGNNEKTQLLRLKSVTATRP